MKRSEIREFVRLGVVAIQQPDFTFTFGLLTDWNAKRDNVYPCVFNPSLEVDTDFPTQTSPPNDTWPVQLYIVKKDALDSAPEQYESLIDQCDFVAQQLMYQYRKIVDGYKLTSIGASSRKAWIKKNADCCTGVIMEFTINNDDQTDVCP